MLDVTVSRAAGRPAALSDGRRPAAGPARRRSRRGIDLFDCVMPTRNGRNALAFTDDGPLRLRNLRCIERDDRPLEADCPCPACRHSRAYLRHLFMAGEMLGPILLTLHNLTYYQRLMAGARAAIEQDRFTEYFEAQMAGWQRHRVLTSPGSRLWIYICTIASFSFPAGPRGSARRSAASWRRRERFPSCWGGIWRTTTPWCTRSKRAAGPWPLRPS